MRIGIGYDFHRLVKDRKLILGGIEIPYSKGLLAHSDGDALLHAIGDAILGACGKRDIGCCFPDTDPKYKGISSLELIKEIMCICKDNSQIAPIQIINIDSVIVCEAPNLSSYNQEMREKIAKTLNINSNLISIKAKTQEGVGLIGKGKGIAVYSVVLIDT